MHVRQDVNNWKQTHLQPEFDWQSGDKLNRNVSLYYLKQHNWNMLLMLKVKLSACFVLLAANENIQKDITSVPKSVEKQSKVLFLFTDSFTFICGFSFSLFIYLFWLIFYLLGELGLRGTKVCSKRCTIFSNAFCIITCSVGDAQRQKMEKLCHRTVFL